MGRNGLMTQTTDIGERVEAAIAAMPKAERVRTIARAVLVAQMEREPTDAQLELFINSGDYARAIEDPTTFERLAARARFAEILGAHLAMALRLSDQGDPGRIPVERLTLLNLVWEATALADRRLPESARARQ